MTRIWWLVAALLLATSPARAESMSVGGAFGEALPGIGGPDDQPQPSRDDPAGDGPEFTGLDVLAILQSADPSRDGGPDGLTVLAVDEPPLSPLDRSLGSVGVVRLVLGDPARPDMVMWQAYQEAAAAFTAGGMVAEELAQQFPQAQVQRVDPDDAGLHLSCGLAQPRQAAAHALCATTSGLDPLLILGSAQGPAGNQDEATALVQRAAAQALWGRQRWQATLAAFRGTGEATGP